MAFLLLNELLVLVDFERHLYKVKFFLNDVEALPAQNAVVGSYTIIIKGFHYFVCPYKLLKCQVLSI